MLDKIHDHIMSELTQNKRTDTVFFIATFIFNLLMLAINSIVQTSKDYLVFIIFIILSVIISLVTILFLLRGKSTRKKYVTGILMIYDDNNVAKYYDRTILNDDDARYRLEIIAISASSLTSIIIPLVLKITNP
jgi:hypothetical protein